MGETFAVYIKHCETCANYFAMTGHFPLSSDQIVQHLGTWYTTGVFTVGCPGFLILILVDSQQVSSLFRFSVAS